MVNWKDEEDDNDSAWPTLTSRDEKISLFNAFLIGLDERLELVKSENEQNKLYNFAPSFGHLLVKCAVKWEEDHFSLMIAKPRDKDKKPIVRLIGPQARRMRLHGKNDIFVYGRAFLDILEQNRNKLVHELGEYLTDDEYAAIQLMCRPLEKALDICVEAVYDGFRILLPEMSKYGQRGAGSGAQDRRQLKAGNALTMKAGM